MFGREREDKINLANYTVTTMVGSDTVVEGTIITKSSVRIDGTLIGGVSAEGVVILTKQGKIHGNIMAENIIVAGVVEGNMQIREKVDVEPTGEIYGDITTKKLLIDEESIFQGNCYMNRDKQAEIAKRKEKTEDICFGEKNEGSGSALKTSKGQKTANIKKEAFLDGAEEAIAEEVEKENSKTAADAAEADDDIDFLDVNVSKNSSSANDNKRRRS